jgi:hypothetical protein
MGRRSGQRVEGQRPFKIWHGPREWPAGDLAGISRQLMLHITGAGHVLACPGAEVWAALAGGLSLCLPGRPPPASLAPPMMARCPSHCSFPCLW